MSTALNERPEASRSIALLAAAVTGIALASPVSLTQPISSTSAIHTPPSWVRSDDFLLRYPLAERLVLHGATPEDVVTVDASPSFRPSEAFRLRSSGFKRGPEWRI